MAERTCHWVTWRVRLSAGRTGEYLESVKTITTLTEGQVKAEAGGRGRKRIFSIIHASKIKESELLRGFRCVWKKIEDLEVITTHFIAEGDGEHTAPDKTSLRLPTDSPSSGGALLTATTLTSSWHSGKTTTFYNFWMAWGLAGDTGAENTTDNRWVNVCQDTGRGGETCPWHLKRVLDLTQLILTVCSVSVTLERQEGGAHRHFRDPYSSKKGAQGEPQRRRERPAGPLPKPSVLLS